MSKEDEKEGQGFQPEGFSLDIFKNRYALTEEESWESACLRVATQMAMPEKPERIEKYKERFNNILVNNYFVPGGRIWYNSGRPDPQLLNCFVLVPSPASTGVARVNNPSEAQL